VLAEQLARIDASAVQHAGALVATLTPTRHCTDREWLAQLPSSDETPAANELREQIVAAQLELAMGRFDVALHRAEASSERARDLDSDRMRAEATAVRAHALVGLGRSDDAETAYFEAIRLADASHHDALAVESWRRLVELAAYGGDHEAAQRWLELLDGAVLRIGDPPDARAEYFVAVGLLAESRNEHAGAEQALRAALQLFEDAGMEQEPDALETMHRLADVLSMLGRHGAAEELHRRAAAITRARWGDGHPGMGTPMLTGRRSPAEHG
jgi:tetratricopeptide (TPR) repeat protein